MEFSEIKNNPKFCGYINRIKTEYDESSGSELPELTHILYNIYYETGSRKEYEAVYFKRRRALLITALMCFLYEKEEYINRLEYIINCICSEFTWALPAHTQKDDPNPKQMIDLFAAETGQALSQIYQMLGGKLSKEIRQTIDTELETRIANAFDTKRFHWEKIDNNWSAVCGGSVGMTLIYRFPEIFKRNEQRIRDIMDVYISGFGDDGICREGLGYWNYGFWYFTGFANLYRERYGVDIINRPKVKNIAMCQQNMFMGGNTVISFSDSTRTSVYNYGLAHYYNEQFGNEIIIPDNGFEEAIDHCSRFLPPVYSVLWHREDAFTGESNIKGETFFADCGWYINRKANAVFAAKGGHNSESHNHNDIGSFILAVNGEQCIADYGSGEYTRDYFLDDKRYSFFVTSSRGHSVPIIDGQYQEPGKEHKASIIKSGDGAFELEMSKAYEISSLEKLNRKFEIKESSVLFEDSFVFSDGKKHRITERFISLLKPEINNKNTVIGNIVIECDTLPEISAETVKSHLDASDETVYIIDYKSDEKFTMTVKWN